MLHRYRGVVIRTIQTSEDADTEQQSRKNRTIGDAGRDSAEKDLQREDEIVSISMTLDCRKKKKTLKDSNKPITAAAPLSYVSLGNTRAAYFLRPTQSR